jgi:Uroporphyrinogen decarboxylase (URO-D)
LEKNWADMTSDERQESLFQSWLSPQGVKFADGKAEKAYKERVTRLKDAVQLKEIPDRVPIVPMTGFFPSFNAGFSPKDVMYDYSKIPIAWKKYVMDFKPDAHGGAMVAVPGKMYDILDYKLYSWPGHGVAANHSYQAIEGEYVKADEYDALIEDPSNFFRSTYFPRIFGALQPFSILSTLTNVLEIYGGFTTVNIMLYGLPPVQAALKALMEAGSEAWKWGEIVIALDKEMSGLGFPDFFGGGCKAPFDTIGDTLRGTRGIMMDMYRQPNKLLKALEAFTPLMVKMGASAAKMNGNPIVFIPLHKGADGFLSDEQFKKFYWPSLRNLLLGLIAEGCVPFPWAEGGYNSRLDIVGDVPAGKVIWGFDATDMAKAKKALGKVACVTGNVPMSLLQIGTPADVKTYAKKLIDSCGKGGGYIMMNGASIDEAKPENMKAWIDYSQEYGIYK